MAVERVVELRDVARGAEGRKRNVELLPVRAGEREGRRVAVGDPEAVEHLGGQREVRREAAEVRVVVARDERLDEIEDLRDRRSVDRDETSCVRATRPTASTT